MGGLLNGGIDNIIVSIFIFIKEHFGYSSFGYPSSVGTIEGGSFYELVLSLLPFLMYLFTGIVISYYVYTLIIYFSKRKSKSLFEGEKENGRSKIQKINKLVKTSYVKLGIIFLYIISGFFFVGYLINNLTGGNGEKIKSIIPIYLKNLYVLDEDAKSKDNETLKSELELLQSDIEYFLYQQYNFNHKGKGGDVKKITMEANADFGIKDGLKIDYGNNDEKIKICSYDKDYKEIGCKELNMKINILRDETQGNHCEIKFKDGEKEVFKLKTDYIEPNGLGKEYCLLTNIKLKELHGKLLNSDELKLKESLKIKSPIFSRYLILLDGNLILSPGIYMEANLGGLKSGTLNSDGYNIDKYINAIKSFINEKGYYLGYNTIRYLPFTITRNIIEANEGSLPITHNYFSKSNQYFLVFTEGKNGLLGLYGDIVGNGKDNSYNEIFGDDGGIYENTANVFGTDLDLIREKIKAGIKEDKLGTIGALLIYVYFLLLLIIGNLFAVGIVLFIIDYLLFKPISTLSKFNNFDFKQVFSNKRYGVILNIFSKNNKLIKLIYVATIFVLFGLFDKIFNFLSEESGIFSNGLILNYTIAILGGIFFSYIILKIIEYIVSLFEKNLF